MSTHLMQQKKLDHLEGLCLILRLFVGVFASHSIFSCSTIFYIIETNAFVSSIKCADALTVRRKLKRTLFMTLAQTSIKFKSQLNLKCRLILCTVQVNLSVT